MLFLKECKKVIFSLTFWIYCLIVVLDFTSQYYPDCRDAASPPYDGYKLSEDHGRIMEGAVKSLAEGYLANRYICYPLGFYKAVKLNEKERGQIEECLEELTGLSAAEISALDESAEKYGVYDGLHEYTGYNIESIPLSDTLTYERFTELMGKVDHTLGGGSDFKPDDLVFHFSKETLTKEEALKEYADFTDKDRITGALARLFSDYAGITLGILPVFVAAALTAADRKRRMTELVYSRRISSFRLIFTRFAALTVTMFVPVLLTMAAALIQAVRIYGGSNISYAAMFTVPSFWLIPNIMEAAAAGMLLTELISGGAAILVQFVLWFIPLLRGSGMLWGNISRFTLICRHNSLFYREQFITHMGAFVFSRIFYILISLILVLLTVLVYELKRGGRFNGVRLFGESGILRRKA